MKIKRLLLVGAAAALMLGSTLTVNAASVSEIEYDSVGNAFIGGEAPKLNGAVMFGGFGSGRDITMEDITSKDSLAFAGMNINISSSEAGGSLYTAGYSIDIRNTNVAGNIVAAGNEITVDENSSAKAIIAAGNVVRLDGDVEAANIAASTVIINGTINGDANISAETVELGDNARITGKLKIESDNDVIGDAKGKASEYEYERVTSSEDAKPSVGSIIFGKVKSAIYWAIAMTIVTLLMCLFASGRINEGTIMLKEKTGIMLGSGAIALIATPVAIILAAITVIGLPVAGITAVVYGLSLVMAVAFAGAVCGRLVFVNMNSTLASILGVVILEVAKQIPYLGFLIGIGSALITLGFVVQLIWSGRAKKSPEVETVYIEEKTEIIE